MKSNTKKIVYKRSLKSIESILNSINLKNEDVIDDIARTKLFINNSYKDFYNGKIQEIVGFAFLIPLRVSRYDSKYWVDVYDYMPALKYLSLTDAYNILVKLPPTSLEMYGKPGQPSRGVLVFVPIFEDMIKDYNLKLLLKYRINKIINESVEFAKSKHGVEYIGLGAMLPKVTNYGKSIKSNVITTTGHAGTVWLLSTIAVDQINKKYSNLKQINIGFIGGGAIGSATMVNLAKIFPNANFIIHDKRQKINHKNYNLLKELGVSVKISGSNKELIHDSQIIISAITSEISLKDINLKGKTIIDDSQPGSFDRNEVINSGGELLWVVGKDCSEENMATRRSGYSYGPFGLHNDNDVWGCEAEVASIAFFNAKEYAVKGPVQPKDVENIGKLFKEVGITISDNQSYGQNNDTKI